MRAWQRCFVHATWQVAFRAARTRGQQTTNRPRGQRHQERVQSQGRRGNRTPGWPDIGRSIVWSHPSLHPGSALSLRYLSYESHHPTSKQALHEPASTTALYTHTQTGITWTAGTDVGIVLALSLSNGACGRMALDPWLHEDRWHCL